MATEGTTAHVQLVVRSGTGAHFFGAKCSISLLSLAFLWPLRPPHRPRRLQGLESMLRPNVKAVDKRQLPFLYLDECKFK